MCGTAALTRSNDSSANSTPGCECHPPSPAMRRTLLSFGPLYCIKAFCSLLLGNPASKGINICGITLADRGYVMAVAIKDCPLQPTRAVDVARENPGQPTLICGHMPGGRRPCATATPTKLLCWMIESLSTVSLLNLVRRGLDLDTAVEDPTIFIFYFIIHVLVVGSYCYPWRTSK